MGVGIVGNIREERLLRHPCFRKTDHSEFGRIHLPVAPRCNIQCSYCDRRYDCANESRPGVTSQILSPEAAVERVKNALAGEIPIAVAGIAGPGEPLANLETFETLREIRRFFSELILCVSTNGLLLEEKLPELIDLGLDTLTVTVNTLKKETAEQIYDTKKTDVEMLLERQKRGIRYCREKKLLVKINTILIPGVNETEIGEIAQFAAKEGVDLMNLMPLIPCGAMSGHRAPTQKEVSRAREKAGKQIPQFVHCRQCRADACGMV